MKMQSVSPPVSGMNAQRLCTATPTHDSANEATDEPPSRAQLDWYHSIPNQRLQQRSGNWDVDVRLDHVKMLIKQGKADPNAADQTFDEIRGELHRLAFLHVTGIALRRKRMLHDDSGIPKLFDRTSLVEYPWDIRADAYELYNRWARREFSPDLLRGIIKRPQAGGRAADRIDPNYAGKMKADYYGQGGLVNGQWWPTQLCAVRDGAHGCTQGGIYAPKGKAAYSIVLSGGHHYDDCDQGENIWYSGTEGKDGKISDNTESLMRNVTTRTEVRVIRSHNISPSASDHRPPCGMRYDGCYEVVSYRESDRAKMLYRFHLRRMDNQDPIRSCGKEMRPTNVERTEYDSIRSTIEAFERI